MPGDSQSLTFPGVYESPSRCEPLKIHRKTVTFESIWVKCSESCHEDESVKFWKVILCRIMRIC